MAETLLAIHENGKKHKRFLKNREDKKNSADRSIYVRGFKNSATLDSDINEYFSHFGKIVKYFVDKEKVS